MTLLRKSGLQMLGVRSTTMKGFQSHACRNRESEQSTRQLESELTEAKELILEIMATHTATIYAPLFFPQSH